MSPDRIGQIRQQLPRYLLRAAFAGALTLGSQLPLVESVYGAGCQVKDSGPIEINRPLSQVFKTVSGTDGVVQIQIWTPLQISAPLSGEINAVLDAAMPGIEYPQGVAGRFWEYSLCDRDTAMRTFGPHIAGRPFAQVASLIEAGLLIGRPEMRTQLDTPNAPAAPAPAPTTSAGVPEQCNALADQKDFPDPNSPNNTFGPYQTMTRLQLFAPTYGFGNTLQEIAVDPDTQVTLNRGATGHSWTVTANCTHPAFMQAMRTWVSGGGANVAYAELTTAGEKQAVTIKRVS